MNTPIQNGKNGRNGLGDKKQRLNKIQQLRWQNTFELLRKHTKATEKEASDFADRKVAVADEVERELALARA